MPNPRTTFAVLAGLALASPVFAQLGSNPNPNDPSSKNYVSPEQTPSDNYGTGAPPRTIPFPTAQEEREKEITTVEELPPEPKRCHWWSLSKECRDERRRGSLRPAR